MPKYDEKNKFHKKVMELAKEATKNQPTDKLYKELEENYLNLCREL